MGEREKNDEMKSRRTNLDPMDPEPDKPAAQDSKDSMNSMNKPVPHHKPEVRLGREVQARIGQQLRSMYDDFLNQGVPDHITDLVRRLAEKE